MKRILVFAGAGASCAVNKDTYPTTIEFFRRLESLNPNIVGDPFFKECVAALGVGDQTVDVEQVLWELDRSLSALDLLLDEAAPLGRHIARDAPGAGHEGRGLAQQIPSLASKLRAQITSLRTSINACVFDLYGIQPLPGWLKDNWTWMLSEFVRRDWHFDIATTNYDLVLEEAIQQARVEINDFYSGNPSSVRRLDLDRVLTPDAGYRGSLIKLHGSVNWQYQKDGSVALGGAIYLGDEKRHAVIYPGFKGAPTHEPFSTLHRLLSNSLPTYDGVIFVGFGFRDEYLNRLFETRLRTDCRIAIVNRSAAYRAPSFASKFVHRVGEGNGFDAKSARAASDYMDGVASAEFGPATKRTSG